MVNNTNYDLKPSEKIDILYRLLRGEKISDLIDDMDNSSVIGLQKFMWEKAAEFGIICHGKNFTRKEITKKMTPTVKFQHKQGCHERPYYCKGTQCIHTNSKCARLKIKEHVDVMADSLREYIHIEQQEESFES